MREVAVAPFDPTVEALAGSDKHSTRNLGTIQGSLVRQCLQIPDSKGATHPALELEARCRTHWQARRLRHR